MDEISRDPTPEPTNDDPSAPFSRRFAVPPLGPMIQAESSDVAATDFAASLDAPPPLGEPRFSLAEGSAEGDADMQDPEDADLPLDDHPLDDHPLDDPSSNLPGDAPDQVGAAGGGAERAQPEGDAEPEEDEEPAAATPGEALSEVPPLTDPRALARVVFAALLASRDAVSFLRLAQVCNTTQKAIEEALVLVRDDLAAQSMPLELAVVGGSARLLTTPDVFPYLQRLKAIKKAERLTPAAIETLAVIAYKQPVIRAEIEAIRGVKAGPMLRALLDHKLVRIKGRRDVPGKPLEYETTPHFLERFGIQTLKDLPSLREFKAIEGS